MADGAVLNPAPIAVKTKISTIMGPAELGSAPIATMVSDHFYNATTTVIDDVDGILGGTRFNANSAAGLSSGDKTTLGIDKIHSTLEPAYLRAGSVVLHNGSVENLLFHNATVYKISAKEDFEAVASLISTRMAYLYINANGDSGEATTALGNYTTELGTLS